MSDASTPHISPDVALIREALDVLTGSTGPVTEDAFTEPARAALARLEEQLETTQAALKREAEQRIRDCEDRNAYKRRADLADLKIAAALRELERASDARVNRTGIIGNVHLILQDSNPASRPSE